MACLTRERDHCHSARKVQFKVRGTLDQSGRRGGAKDSHFAKRIIYELGARHCDMMMRQCYAYSWPGRAIHRPHEDLCPMTTI